MNCQSSTFLVLLKVSLYLLLASSCSTCCNTRVGNNGNGEGVMKSHKTIWGGGIKTLLYTLKEVGESSKCSPVPRKILHPTTPPFQVVNNDRFQSSSNNYLNSLPRSSFLSNVLESSISFIISTVCLTDMCKVTIMNIIVNNISFYYVLLFELFFLLFNRVCLAFCC